MDTGALLSEKLEQIAGQGNVLENEPMSRHCTFRTGGAARYLVTVDDEESLIALMSLLEKEELPWFLLGNGSNLLVSDTGYDGIMIRLGKGFEQISVRDNVISAGSAAPLSRIAAFAAENAIDEVLIASDSLNPEAIALAERMLKHAPLDVCPDTSGCPHKEMLDDIFKLIYEKD